MGKEDFLLLDLIFCLRCGGKFVHHEKESIYKAGSVTRRYYKCKNECKDNDQKSIPIVSAKKIEDKVVSFVEESLHAIKLGISPYIPSEKEIRLNNLLKEKRNLIKSIDEIKVDKNDKIMEIIEIDKKINNLRREHDLVNEATGNKETVQAAYSWLKNQESEEINYFFQELVRVEIDTVEKFGYIILIRNKNRKLQYPECVNKAWGLKFKYKKGV